MIYVHPREIDPEHPRLPLSARRKFTSYVNLRTTRPKIRQILRDFKYRPLTNTWRRRRLEWTIALHISSMITLPISIPFTAATIARWSRS